MITTKKILVNYDDNPSFEIHFKFDLVEEVESEGMKVVIGNNEQFGNMLFINDEIQATEYDTKIYHDAVAKHIGDNDSVLIVGDGDGGFTHYPWSKNAVVIERSKLIMDLSEKYLDANWNNVKEICCIDFKDYVFKEKYDVIIFAVSDDFNRNGVREFCKKAIANLNKGGKLIAQVGSTFDIEAIPVVVEYTNIGKILFPTCCFEKTYVPSFFCEEIFFIGTIE